MKRAFSFVVLGSCVAVALACSKKSDPPPQEPQPYYQQQPQPYPQQQPQPYPTAQPQPYPTAQPQPAPTAAPAATGSAGTPTAIPGVTKNADGTCAIMVPGGTAPMVMPCPPGI